MTATLTGGAWAANISPWTRTSATTATYTFTFEPASCIMVDPRRARCRRRRRAPTVWSCRPASRLVRTDGVIYTLDPHDPGDGTTDVVITVTATLSDGYAWVDPLPTAGRRSGDTTIVRFELTLEAGTCTPVTPAAPTVTQAVCADGVLSAPTLVLADTDGVTYTRGAGGAVCAG